MPLLSAFVTSFKPVSVLVRTTVAPEMTAPVVSCTTPVMVP
jgi:hypothetical protein